MRFFFWLAFERVFLLELFRKRCAYWDLIALISCGTYFFFCLILCTFSRDIGFHNGSV